MKDAPDSEYSQTEPKPSGESPGYLPRQLVLLGAGHAHIEVLTHLAAHPLVGARITLIAPHHKQVYSAMLPGFVAGHYSLDDCTLALDPLVRRGGIRWLTRSVRGLNAQTQSVQLDDGSNIHYDWLSINTGPVQNRALLEQSIPGIREHGMFIRPMESFAGFWPKVAELGTQRALRIALIGGGAAGIELAMAVRQRMAQAAITLISGPERAGAAFPAPVQRKLLALLKARRITLLQDSATAVNHHEIVLASGARLACDVPLVTTGAQAPPWIAASGLDRDAQGFVAVDACQRSTSHPQVFAAGDVSTRMDIEHARNGVHALRTGAPLARNLAAAVAGTALRAYTPPAKTLNVITCGGRQALAVWGERSVYGGLVWWLKSRSSRRYLQRLH